jgi:hypothetical protein
VTFTPRTYRRRSRAPAAAGFLLARLAEALDRHRHRAVADDPLERVDLVRRQVLPAVEDVREVRRLDADVLGGQALRHLDAPMQPGPLDRRLHGRSSSSPNESSVSDRA